MLVQTEDVREVLTVCLGESLVKQTGLSEACTDLLRSWAPGTVPPETLCARLEECLFNRLYALLGPSLQVKPEKAMPWRIPMEAFPEIADRLMCLAFLDLRPCTAYFEMLRAYGMLHASNAAFFTLRQHFASYQTAAETAVQERILRENGWL